MENDTDIDQFGLQDFPLVGDGSNQDQLTLQPSLHDELPATSGRANTQSVADISIDGAGSTSFNNNNNNRNHNVNNSNHSHNHNSNIHNTATTTTADDFEGMLFGLNQYGLPSNTFNPGDNNIIFKPNNTLTNLESPEQIIISNANSDYDNNNFNQYINTNDMIDIDSPNNNYSSKGANKNAVFNMPGAFRNSTTDYMDLEDSPQFTIESDSNTYYDQNLRPSIIDIQDTESLFKSVNNNSNNNNHTNNNKNTSNNNSKNNLNNTSILLTVPSSSNLTNKTPPGSKGETSSISPFDNSSRVSSGHNVNQFPNGNAMFMNNNAAALTAFPTTTTTHVNPSTTLNANSESIIFDEIHQEINRIRKDSIDSYYSNHLVHTPNNNNNNSAGVNVTLPSQQFNNLSVHNNVNPANNKFLNDLSPLTTTTSLTPSVNSIHSTQPSFFSAHQYLSRNSLEQPPSGNPHRPSFDLFNNKLVENQSPSAVSTSSRRNPSSGTRYSSFTNSISNILPFMSDKNNNQRSPPSIELPSSPSNSLITSPQPGSRHLIRSIFKSSVTKNSTTNGINPFGNNTMNNNNINSGNNNGNLDFLDSDAFIETTINSSSDTNNDFLMMSPTKEETDFDNINNLDVKKAKRSKMNLFTRFKTTPSKQQELQLQQLQQQSQNPQIDDFEAKLLLEERQSLENVIALNNVSVEASTLSSRTPSTATNHNALDYTSSNNSHQQTQSQTQVQSQSQSQSQSLSQSQTFLPTQEPDYAALFENVGKRKNKSTKKVKVKSEEEKSNLLSLNLGSSSSTKSKIKMEQDGSNPSTEKSSIFNIKLNSSSNNNNKGSDVASGTNISVSSSNGSASLHAQYSQTSDNTSHKDADQTTTSFANASKRILGSKLMSKRKSSGNIKTEEDETSIKEELDEDDISSITTTNSNPIVATMIQKGVEVEVDLKSLDLPANTQIFPTSIINSKNRTRGRKENKEADINDQAKIYLCNYCSRRFKRQEHLKRHFRSLHTFEKPYVCDICHKKFSRSDNLNQHLKIHKLEEEGGLGVDGEVVKLKQEEDVEMG